MRSILGQCPVALLVITALLAADIPSTFPLGEDTLMCAHELSRRSADLTVGSPTHSIAAFLDHYDCHSRSSRVIALQHQPVR